MQAADDRFDVHTLAVPIVLAPMAGGPSTPALAAAVSNTGALGFIAAGYRTATQLEDDIARTRSLTDKPFGVNVFVPVPSQADATEIGRYARELATDAARYGVALASPHPDDDGWQGKIDVLVCAEPSLASFTFGSPGAGTVERLHDAGITVIVTVTTLDEAREAARDGADALSVQGPEAGGHRATFDPTARPSEISLDSLLALVSAESELPLIAAGGVGDRDDVARLLAAGAVAAQAGTAFLRAVEAGTRQSHREALASAEFTETTITRAFSGRYGRGLVNDFIRDHDATAPLGYPDVNQLTGPIRAAAAAAGDPHRLNLWAGTGFARTLAGPAAGIVARLTP